MQGSGMGHLGKFICDDDMVTSDAFLVMTVTSDVDDDD
jgi:hypothetical protein